MFFSLALSLFILSCVEVAEGAGLPHSTLNVERSMFDVEFILGETAPFTTFPSQHLGSIVQCFLLNPDKIGTPKIVTPAFEPGSRSS